MTSALGRVWPRRVFGESLPLLVWSRAAQAYKVWRQRKTQERVLARIQRIISRRPLDINIETTNFCAASCVFCPNSKIKRQKSSMEMALFRKICDEYAALGGGAVGISSMQSDLFADKQLLDRLEYLCKYSNLYPYTTTYLVGAAKLDDRELEFFLRVMRYLQISFGGVEGEGYRQMYGMNGFQVAKTQLFRIKKIVDMNNIDIKLHVFFRTQHQEDVIRKSKLIEELGDTFSTMEVKNSFFSWGGIIKQEDLPKGASLLLVDNTMKRVDCAVASASMCINVDGSVLGCGCVDWNSRHVVGNVQSSSLKEVWQSKQAIEFKKAFSRNKIPDLCKDCSLYLPVNDAFSRLALRDYEPHMGLYYNQ